MNPATAPADVDRFRDIIAERLGLQFDDSRLGFLAEVLCRQVGDQPRACAPYLLRLEGAATAELDALALELSVPETYFFRHIDQFRAFSDAAIPARIRARRGDKKLRILSAGCASGEEPYTLAMAIRELAIAPGWDVSIRAVDMNRAALERAAAGRFSSWSLRETPPILQRRWFSPRGRDFQLDGSIMAQVVFERRNLADENPDLWPPDFYDVVFCRNVIMYFTPRTAGAMIDRIARSLAPGGFLFLGHAENLRGRSHEFHLCHTHDTFYYSRKAEEERTRPRRTTPDRFGPGAGFGSAEPEGSWVDAIGKAADRIRLLSEAPAQTARRRRASSAGAAVPPAPAREARRWDLGSPIELLRQERFGEALRMVQVLPPESAADPDVRLLEAVLLAHSGQLARAEKVCRELLEIDEFNAGAHYVLALSCEGSGDRRRAVEHDQIATYLDPGFAMPRLHLGLLARRAGEHAEARRELTRALDLLEREDSSRVLLFGGGFGREALVALCRAELVACGGRP